MAKKQKVFRTVAVEWETFADYVFRGMNPSPTQRNEMRKAFYGGFSALMFQLKQLDDGVPDEVAMEHLNVLDTELKLFAAIQKKLGEQSDAR
jgi:hypothetical protein